MRTVPLVNAEDPISLEGFKPGNEAIMINLGNHKTYYHPNSFKNWYGNQWVGKQNIGTQQLIHRKNQVQRVKFNEANKVVRNFNKLRQIQENEEAARMLQNWYNAENRAKKLKENENLQRIMNDFRKILARHAKSPKKNNLW